jgi:hypothetical protein
MIGAAVLLDKTTADLDSVRAAIAAGTGDQGKLLKDLAGATRAMVRRIEILHVRLKISQFIAEIVRSIEAEEHRGMHNG